MRTRIVEQAVPLVDELGLSDERIEFYKDAVSRAARLLQRHGFGFIIGQVSVRLRYNNGRELASYNIRKKQIRVTVLRHSTWHESAPAAVTTMVHEMGHHYYYNEISRRERNRYKWLFRRAKEFSSFYATQNAAEDFAETFAAVVGEGIVLHPVRFALPTDVLDRFLAFVGQDPRVEISCDYSANTR